MNEQNASPLGEAILWSLYRRLLAANLFATRLQGGRDRSLASAAISVALAENLHEGDTLGLAAGDLATRYLCGVPLESLGRSAHRAKASAPAWLHPGDAEHGLLPGGAAERASLALGTALAARLHQTGGITVLFDPGGSTVRRPAASQAGWESAAETAIALGLPLLCITGERTMLDTGPGTPAAALPVIPVDRADAIALYRVIYESAARARSGSGPTWIECHAWSGARQRGAAAAERPGDAEPLPKMEQMLRARKLFEERKHRQLVQAIEKEFASAGFPAKCVSE